MTYGPERLRIQLLRMPNTRPSQPWKGRGGGRGPAGRRGAGRGLRGGKGQVGGHRRGEIEREEERERGCMGGTKTKNSMGNNIGKAHRRRNPRPRRWQIHRLRTNRQSDRRNEGTWTKLSTRRMQRYPQIPPTTHGSKVIARRSYHRSWNRPELRRAITGVSDLNWGRGFEIRKGLDERIPTIYID
jgi:hypothetical protein